MRSEDISNLRLVNQQISSSKFSTVKELVSYMGALQAQDYSMAKWALGARLNNADEHTINSSIKNGDILRTHLLRPTWHFVSSDDINRILALTAPRIKSAMRSRNKELGLTSAIFRRSNTIIGDALSGNNHLTREEIIKLLDEAKIKTDRNRASHLLMEAELDGIICSGKDKGSKPTYALLRERVKKINSVNREESLAKLAEIYFTSRGPAALNDFAWWSGLKITDARAALEMIGHKLNSFVMDSQTYWFSGLPKINPKPDSRVFLLPGYDEFLLSYKDRSAVMNSESHRSLISFNGIFRPIIVYNGKIIGIWKRIIKDAEISLEMYYLYKPDKKIQNLAINAVQRFGLFTGKRINRADHKLISGEYIKTGRVLQLK